MSIIFWSPSNQMRRITPPTSHLYCRCHQSQQIEILAYTNLTRRNKHYRRHHWSIATGYDLLLSLFLQASHCQCCSPPPSLVWVFTPREYDCADFGCIWIQSNGVVTHVKIKGCCKSETFKLLQYRAFWGIGKGFLTNLLLTSQKLLRKRTVLFFFGTMNDGKAHSE